jgi:hypothetical protein
MKIDINKTIEHNGKTYKCRSREMELLSIYEVYSEKMPDFPYFAVYRQADGNIASYYLEEDMSGSDGFGLIEVKSQKQQLIDLLERGERVLCDCTDGGDLLKQVDVIRKHDAMSEFSFTGDFDCYRNARPLTQSELDSMSFEKLINKERE